MKPESHLMQERRLLETTFKPSSAGLKQYCTKPPFLVSPQISV